MSDVELSLTPKKHTVTIEYCVPCDYSARALQVAGELVRNYQHLLDNLVLEMGSKGVFAVRVNGDTIFSKRQEGRHPAEGEVLKRFRAHVGEVNVYPRQTE